MGARRKTDDTLRGQLRTLLRGGRAHADFEKAIANLPPRLRGKKPRLAPYTPWQQLEHIRLAQRDILDYIRDPDYVSPPWPEGYWPRVGTPPTASAWDETVTAYRSDRRALEKMVADPTIDLLAPLPHDPGVTLLQEILLVADHTAYHLGQLIVLRRLIGAWSD
jgi:DinB superfamily